MCGRISLERKRECDGEILRAADIVLHAEGDSCSPAPQIAIDGVILLLQATGLSAVIMRGAQTPVIIQPVEERAADVIVFGPSIAAGAQDIIAPRPAAQIPVDAGTSFATVDNLNKLQYGSSLMNITGDRVTPHGLSTVGYDDEGVEAQRWDIIKDGLLVGYQLDRRIAARAGRERSNGCAFADSPSHVPIQRMPNVSLQPNPNGPDLDGLIASVEDGILIKGDNSWSIDMQRYNFQFTGQQFHRIKNGEIVGQVKDVAYQATTTDFWRSMKAVGGPSTYVLGGAFNCGKAQPGQIAAVSHGCPAAVFDKVNVLNTVAEAGK